MDENGNVIGVHNGSYFLTIGERHGFTITRKTPNDEPYYVISKDVGKNIIIVANKTPEGHLPRGINTVKLKGVNWNQGEALVSKKLQARSRYREKLQDIRLIDDHTVEFEKVQSTISPGQSLVVYDGDICLGGGIIF